MTITQRLTHVTSNRKCQGAASYLEVKFLLNLVVDGVRVEDPNEQRRLVEHLVRRYVEDAERGPVLFQQQLEPPVVALETRTCAFEF